MPKETALLPNYPNPFNPETWIPYQLAKPADVSISIYAADGKLVRTLELGHQPVGIYESRSRAVYWDGRNALGEPVASGVYFYTLTAGEFTATRKMLIQTINKRGDDFMKNKRFSILLIWFVIFISAQNILAQDSPQWHLPEGAKARLGKGGISEIAYSLDGRRLAVATAIGIWLYDVQTGEELDLLTGHRGAVHSVAFSPDGNIIVSGGGYDGTIRLWDANTGRHIRTLTGHAGTLFSISFSPDGTTLASGSDDRTIRLWNAETGSHIRTLTGHAEWITSISFSPDGTTLASGSYDETIRLWNVNDGRNIRTLTGHAGTPFSISFSPDGTTLASGSGDRTIRLWNTNNGRNIRTITGHTSSVTSVAFSPDGNTIVSGGGYDRAIRLWNTNNGKSIRTLRGHTSWVNSVAFSPDGNTIASADQNGPVRLWNARTGNHIRTLSGHTNRIWSVSFSPDGTTLASGGSDDTVRLWNARTGQHIRTLSGHMSWVSSVSFSPDGTTLASGSDDDTVRLWNARTGQHIRTLSGHMSWVSSVSFSPDGTTLASGSDDDTVRLWNARTGQHIRTLSGHTNGVSSVSFSPDGTTLASGSDDDTVRLWNARTGNHIRTLSRHTNGVLSVAFSPDGNTLASGSWDTTLRLWNASDGRHIRTLTGHVNGVNSIAFSADGNVIASGAFFDGTIRLWNASDGRHIRTLWGHTSNVYSVSFSPDGRTLASGSADGTALLWELAHAATSNATLRLSPASPQSPAIGEQLTFSLKIADAENVAGYQATVSFDTSALRYVESANGDYLPSGAFFIPPVAEDNTVTLAASSLAGESDGNGTLATLMFEVVAVKPSTVRLTNVLLTDGSGGSSVPQIENAEITAPLQLPEDVNQDGVVNIIDLTLVASNFSKTGQNAADVNNDGVVNIIDLTLVAAAFGNTAAAPEIWSHHLEVAFTRADLEAWLREAQQMNIEDPAFQRGVLMLEQLLAALTPKETTLLPNYPNPFNPETWIPYQLAQPANVTISIYAMDGRLVRSLDLGNQSVGIYESRSRAAYWDGRNELGESVASGVYFYTLTAGDFTATRKMLIRK